MSSGDHKPVSYDFRQPRRLADDIETILMMWQKRIASQVADDVIRIISRSKDMVRSYAVKLALVQNPKTPLQTSMRFLTLLRESDVRAISKSKNVPQAVSNQAKRLIMQKRR